MVKTRIARQYSASERDSAVRRAAAIGPAAAGRELNIPSGTISCWQYLARRRGATAEGATGESANDSIAADGMEASASAEHAASEKKGGTQRQVGLHVCSAATSLPVKDAEADVQAVVTRQARSSVRVAKVYTPSQRAQVLEYAATEGVTAAANKFGISRFSIYDWQRRVVLHANGKSDNSPVVGSDKNQAAVRDKRILAEWKSHPGLGPSQVRNQLRRQGLKVSLHTVRCVLEAHGYVTPKVRRTEVHDQRYEAVRPNHMWHLDFLHRHINKQKIYVLLIVDDYSRFIVGGALWDGERVAAVKETFLSAVNRHGKPEKVMSDGGSAFYSWRGVGEFTRLLDELEADQCIARTPQNNGKLEVLNANIQKELFNQETFFDLGETQRRFQAWIAFYNFRRTHHALGGLLVPADRYFGRADEVLAQIEAGHTADGMGEPAPPGERQLDLLRISSCRGQVELYLLGHRVALPLKAG